MDASWRPVLGLAAATVVSLVYYFTEAKYGPDENRFEKSAVVGAVVGIILMVILNIGGPAH